MYVVCDIYVIQFIVNIYMYMKREMHDRVIHNKKIRFKFITFHTNSRRREKIFHSCWVCDNHMRVQATLHARHGSQPIDGR